MGMRSASKEVGESERTDGLAAGVGPGSAGEASGTGAGALAGASLPLVAALNAAEGGCTIKVMSVRVSAPSLPPLMLAAATAGTEAADADVAPASDGGAASLI
jgi:hypothetical protein